ncbi:hypothetical protein [Deinococcus ruber]|uniref:Uncharacterized protein n=1 Tax=Deinococcus ruber TaxID=1848197 RepID=A0A918FG35_9DEIO|nr:hypothetical protein [Deinococcus ruber]GGR35654.1 hypothetical protein GCM10008957_51890 [Deinococcus ruber]
MYHEELWNESGINTHLAELRREVAVSRLGRGQRNLWDSLLPPLRRLEGWLERHAGQGRQSAQGESSRRFPA